MTGKRADLPVMRDYWTGVLDYQSLRKFVHDFLVTEDTEAEFVVLPRDLWVPSVSSVSTIGCCCGGAARW